MIRWKEETDALRVEYTHTFEAIFPTLIGVASAIVVVVATYAGLDAMARLGVLAVFLSGLVVLLFLPVALVALRTANRYVTAKGWVEIAVRGGYARWDGGGGTPAREMVAVRSFELDRDEEKRPRIDAVLTDGRRIRVLGPWPALLGGKAEKLAVQMKENLGA